MSGPVAIFDVDGTLVPKPSTEVRFVRFLVARRVIGVRALGRYVLRLPGRLRREGLLGAKTNKACLEGLEAARVAELADAFLDEAGRGLWHPEVYRRLAAHRQAGQPVALLTGTPDFLAAALARRLGAQAWAATELATRSGRLADEVLQHPHGLAKVELARGLAESLGGTLGDAWAYGDSWADRHLLEAVAHPIVVGRGRRLTRLARARHWEIIGPAEW